MEYEGKKRRTRREVFLERMDGLIPWERLETRIRPFYPKAGRGRRPYPLSVMLRIHCVQLFYNMSDPGMEDMLCEVESVRRFTGVRLSGPIPDETTILNFRHLLERHGLGRGLFEEIKAHLAGRGYRVRRGTIVDATIIAAPSSTHSVRTTPANTHDLREAGSLLHGGEEEVWADSGYRGIERWVEAGGRDVRWTVAMAPGRRAPPGSGGSAVAAGAGEGLGACQGGAPVPLPEASLRLPGRSATGGWRRTPSGSRCCTVAAIALMRHYTRNP